MNLRILSYNFIPFLRRWALSLDMDKPKAVFATMQTLLRLFCFVKKVINVTVVFLRERSQGRRTVI